MACLNVLLVVAMLAGTKGQQGYIQDTDTNQYLHCDSNKCYWDVNPIQQFRMDEGKNGQNRFHILAADGTDTTQCLDREHCHSGSSNARMGDCNHCGAYHWGYDGSKMAEDHMKNCIQTSGAVGHCSGSHAPIKWPVESDCKPKSQTITNVKCKNQNTDGTCGANFIQGSTVGGHSVSDCNACDAAEGSTLSCDFTMGVSTSHSYSTSFSSSSGTKVEAGLEFEAGLVFADAKTSLSFSVETTMTTGQATTQTRTETFGSACQATIKAGTRERAKADFFSGTVNGEFTADVTTKYDCPGKKDKTETFTGNMTITDVPTQSVVGSCTLIAEHCSADQLQFQV